MARNTEKNAATSRYTADTRTPGVGKDVSMEVVPIKKDVPDPRYTNGHRNLRTDGAKKSTAFMASCKLVCEESSSMLYHFLDTDEGGLSLRIERDGSVSFLGKKFEPATAKPANFAAMKRVKQLAISVPTAESSNTLSICDVHDAMFIALSGNLKTSHVLQSLDIGIHTKHSDDFGPAMLPSRYADRMHSQLVMREFAGVAPGDVSRAHIAAFLNDALRTIREVKEGKRKGEVQV